MLVWSAHLLGMRVRRCHVSTGADPLLHHCQGRACTARSFSTGQLRQSLPLHRGDDASSVLGVSRTERLRLRLLVYR